MGQGGILEAFFVQLFLKIEFSKILNIFPFLIILLCHFFRGELFFF